MDLRSGEEEKLVVRGAGRGGGGTRRRIEGQVMSIGKVAGGGGRG
jgi:hypothetical protein